MVTLLISCSPTVRAVVFFSIIPLALRVCFTPTVTATTRITALTYELPAATSTANALGISLAETITDPTVFSAIAWVMTLGILPSIILPPVLMKKIQGGVIKMKKKDDKWGDLFMTSMFLGMISAFLGMVFADVRGGIKGLLPIFVLLVSAVLMLVCGLFIKVFKMKWLETYSLAISMVGAMIFAVLIAPVFQ